MRLTQAVVALALVLPTSAWAGGAALQASFAKLAFGDVAAGHSSLPFKLGLWATGGTVSIKEASIDGSPAFTIVAGSDNCTGRTLQANESCSLAVQFTPEEAVGVAEAAVLEVTSSAGDHSIPLSGTPADAVTVTPAGAFGALYVGEIAPASIALRNNQSVAVTVTGMTPSVPFRVAAGGDTCSNTIVAPFATCAVALSFAPTSEGSFTDVLVLSAAPDVVASHVVKLSGKGVEEALGVTPFAVDFGPLFKGAMSAPVAVTVQNNRTVPVSLGSPTFESGASFAAAATTCGPTLGPRKACTVSLVFTPSGGLGKLRDTFSISDLTHGVTQKVALSGTSSQATLATPRKLAFSGVPPGATSAPQLVTVINRSASPIDIAATIAPPFSVTPTACPSVAYGKPCVLAVTYAPETAAAKDSGTLAIETGVDEGYDIVVSGSGGRPPKL